MAGQNDAELSVGITENLTPVLAKMAAQTRAFGNAIEAEAKTIDKAVSQVTGAMGRLAAGGNKAPASAAYSKTIAATTANLAKYRAELERLNHVENAKTNSAGRKYDPNTGRLISQKDLEAFDQAKARVALYSTELERLNRIQNEFSQSRTWQRGADGLPAHLAAAKAEAEGLSRSTRDLEKLYTGMFGRVESVNGRATNWWPPQMLRGPQQFAEAMTEMQNSVRYAMYDVSRNLLIGGAALTALGVGAVVVAAQWQRAFADVERTVQGTPQTLERIRDGLVSLSQDIPVSFKDLAEIASIGGQMGISANGIVAYTETIAKLTATTNLTADAASKALGRFKAFFATASDPSLAVTDATFSNLASSILKVGVNSVATESGIVNVATQISSMGSYAGFTADQVIGLSGALSSIGVPPELSRGVITRPFNTIGEAVTEGGVKLDSFAQIAGVSAQEFASAWQTEDFAYIFTDLVKGISQLDDGVATLHELGITSVRDVPVLLRLASAAGELGTVGSMLAQTMNDARSGWRQNIELSLQYNKIASTLVERTKVLMQNFEALFAAMGSSSVGPVTDMVNGLIQLVKGFTQLAGSPVGQWLGGVTVAASVLAGVLLLLASGGARAFAAMQGLAQGLAAVTGSAAAATAAVRVLGIATLALGAVGAIAAVVGTILAISSASDDAYNSIQDTSGALSALQADAKAGSGFVLGDGLKEARRDAKDLSTQADNLGNVLGFTEDRLYGAAAAADTSGNAMQDAALRYGASAKEFSRAAVTGNKEFQDLFNGDIGSDFADVLVSRGFDLDKALTAAAKNGREGVKDYLATIYKPFGDGLVLPGSDEIISDDVYVRFGELANVLAQTGEGWNKVAAQAYATGEAFSSFTSTTQMTTDAMDDFKLANEEAINSMADGFAKFVDTGSLVGLTQQMKAAFATVDDGSTEIDEHAEAIAGFEKAWADAYGGAKFSIDEYMAVFRRAAEEQQTFITNLQELSARGVPTDIIGDLAAMGPQAQALVQALVDSTDAQLDEYVALYGQTGFESMVALAAGQMAAEQIVRNAARHLSTAELKQLSADLAAGTPLTDAMRKWNLDAEGKPMKVPAEAYLRPGWEPGFQAQFNKGVSMPVRPYLTHTSVVGSPISSNGRSSFYLAYKGGLIPDGFAGGGYTGDGGKYAPKGVVHGGEFVFTKEATKNIGVGNLYAWMRAAQGGRMARPNGGGYANGGFVNTSTQAGIVHLSVEDRMLLVQIRDAVGLSISESTIGTLANADNSNGTTRRTS